MPVRQVTLSLSEKPLDQRQPGRPGSISAGPRRPRPLREPALLLDTTGRPCLSGRHQGAQPKQQQATRARHYASQQVLKYSTPHNRRDGL